MSTDNSRFLEIISCGQEGILLSPMKRLNFVSKLESPQDYFNRILSESGLSHVKVAERARALGHKLSAGYVHNIARGTAINPSVQLIRALAAGIGRPEEEVLSVFRGIPLTEESAYKESLFATMWGEFSNLTAKDQKELRPAIDMLQREIQRRTNQA